MDMDAGAAAAPSSGSMSGSGRADLGPGAISPQEATPQEMAASLRRLWEEGLRAKDVSAEADFFDLGGTSLDLIRQFGQINEAYGLSLDGSALEDEATLARLIACVEAARGEKL